MSFLSSSSVHGHLPLSTVFAYSRSAGEQVDLLLPFLPFSERANFHRSSIDRGVRPGISMSLGFLSALRPATSFASSSAVQFAFHLPLLPTVFAYSRSAGEQVDLLLPFLSFSERAKSHLSLIARGVRPGISMSLGFLSALRPATSFASSSAVHFVPRFILHDSLRLARLATHDSLLTERAFQLLTKGGLRAT